MERIASEQTTDSEADSGGLVSASDSSSEPTISVIVPVYNASSTLRACLAGLWASTWKDYELLVVDDASTDDSAAIVGEGFGAGGPAQGVTLLRQSERAGAFLGRNLAAARARGRVLFFTDADVVVAPDTLERVAQRFQEDAQVDALIGIYSARCAASGLGSLYKNAWIRYGYLRAPARVRWFFTAVGAVRRDVWQQVGGFDASFCVGTGGGDIEFGQRLTSLGHPVELCKDLEVTHCKRHDLRGLLANDLRRAYGYLLLALSPRLSQATGASTPALRVAREGVANVSVGFGLASVVAWLLLLGTPALFLSTASALAWLSLFALYWALNLRFVLFLGAQLGWGIAVRCCALLVLDQLAAGLGSAWAIVVLCVRGVGKLRAIGLRKSGPTPVLGNGE